VKAYLYGAAVREANCLLRWRGRREFADQDAEGLVDPTSEPQDRHLQDALKDAIAELKPEIVEMLILQYEEGCSDAEIARMRGKPRLVVAMKLHRARKRLEKLLMQKKGEK
jgi:DNA-directed RNA polymerase specialized sigma24 family protein